MKRLSLSVLALGLIFASPFTAMAKDAADAAAKAKAAAAAPADPTPDYSPVLQQFKSQGVTETYLGRKYGLDGWLLTKDTKVQVVYVTPDGQGAVIGTLYGPSGKLETSTQLAEAQQKGLIPAAVNSGSVIPPAPGASTAPAAAEPAATATGAPPPGVVAATKAGEAPSERLWKQVEASTYIKIGPDTAPPFYVIMDPRCEYCHKLYTILTDKYLPNNALQLRIIPVGILGADSAKEAQQILSSPDSAKLWTEIERYNFSELPPVAPTPRRKSMPITRSCRIGN